MRLSSSPIAVKTSGKSARGADQNVLDKTISFRLQLGTIRPDFNARDRDDAKWVVSQREFLEFAQRARANL